MTLDQLVMVAPEGKGVHLLRANMDREAKKHWGRAAGLPGSRTKPLVRAKGRKFETPRSKGL
jgi:large subunit ribosomal protein L18e